MTITFNDNKTYAYISYEGARHTLKTKINLSVKKGETVSLNQTISSFLSSYKISKNTSSTEGVKIAWLRKLNYSVGTITKVLNVADSIDEGCISLETLNKKDESDYVKFIKATVKYAKLTYREYNVSGLSLI